MDVTKIQDKDLKYHSSGHDEAMTNRNIGGIDGNHVDHTGNHVGCRGYAGGM